MSDMQKIDLKGSLLMLVVLVGAYGVLKIIALVFLLIVGAVANVAVSGDITVPAVINTTINSTVNSVSTGFGTLNSADTIVLGLIGLVVIMRLFWPMIQQYMPKNGGKGLN